jgi:hypothetical protein
VHPSPPVVPTPRAGLALLFDIFVAPARAYATLAVKAQWWPAALVIIACSVGSNLMILPAELHVEKATLTNADIPRIIGVQVLLLVQMFVAWGFTASIFVALSPPEKRHYATYFALAAVGALPQGLGAVLNGLVIRLHDPASFHSLAQLANAFPLSLSIFTPHAGNREIAFLSAFDLFEIWTLLLVAFGARALGGIRPVVAMIVVFAINFAFALTQALPL